jgi:hypothetical protein
MFFDCPLLLVITIGCLVKSVNKILFKFLKLEHSKEKEKSKQGPFVCDSQNQQSYLTYRPSLARYSDVLVIIEAEKPK